MLVLLVLSVTDHSTLVSSGNVLICCSCCCFFYFIWNIKNGTNEESVSKTSCATVSSVFWLSRYFKDLLVDMQLFTKCPFLWQLLQVWWNTGQMSLVWLLPEYMYCFIMFFLGCEYLFSFLLNFILQISASFFSLNFRLFGWLP